MLELACGPAGVGLRAAGAVAPEGSVLLTDFSRGWCRRRATVPRAGDRERRLRRRGRSGLDLRTRPSTPSSAASATCSWATVAALRRPRASCGRAGASRLAGLGRARATRGSCCRCARSWTQLRAPAPDLDAPGLWALRDPDRLGGCWPDPGAGCQRGEPRRERFLARRVVGVPVRPRRPAPGAAGGDVSADDLAAVRERVGRDVEPFTAADGSLGFPSAINVAVATRPRS